MKMSLGSMEDGVVLSERLKDGMTELMEEAGLPCELEGEAELELWLGLGEEIRLGLEDVVVDDAGDSPSVSVSGIISGSRAPLLGGVEIAPCSGVAS
jgi:hypothetical protein